MISRAGKTEHFLKEVLSEETKLPVQKIVAEEPLEEYGIDSVMILGLSAKLEKEFGEYVPPQVL